VAVVGKSADCGKEAKQREDDRGKGQVLFSFGSHGLGRLIV
jgi:hypothetical protein